jgi:hypothetical protein
MVGAPMDCAAFAEAVVILSCSRELKDPRKQGPARQAPRWMSLLLCLLAVLAGAEAFVDIALFDGVLSAVA